MDGADVAKTVRDERETELSRLGSSKALYAITDGNLEDDVVLERVGDYYHHGQAALTAWDGPAAVDELAATLGELTTATDDARGDDERGPKPAVVEHLDTVAEADDARRLGAALGFALVLSETTSQLTGYFVGQADPQTASTFRSAGEDLEDALATVVDAVDAFEGDRETVLAGAEDVVDAAYDAYVAALEAQGVNPKPVC